MKSVFADTAILENMSDTIRTEVKISKWEVSVLLILPRDLSAI